MCDVSLSPPDMAAPTEPWMDLSITESCCLPLFHLECFPAVMLQLGHLHGDPVWNVRYGVGNRKLDGQDNVLQVMTTEKQQPSDNQVTMISLVFCMLRLGGFW